MSAAEPPAAWIRTPRSERSVPRAVARSTVIGTPSAPLRAPATIRPVRRSSPSRYQPPARAMMAPSSAAATTISATRRARGFMASQYQTAGRVQDSGAERNEERYRPDVLALVTLRQAEHVLREIVQHHLLGHRGDLVQADLAEQSLDVELLGVSVAAMRLHGHVT